MEQEINEPAIKKMIGSFPYYSPSSNFNSKVLSAMGFESRSKELAQAVSARRLKTWLQVALEASIAGWIIAISVLVLFLIAAYARDILFILMNPSLLLANLKLYALKFSFAIANALNLLGWAKDVIITLLSGFNILPKLVISTILAGFTMMSVSKYCVYSHVEEK